MIFLSKLRMKNGLKLKVNLERIINKLNQTNLWMKSRLLWKIIRKSNQKNLISKTTLKTKAVLLNTKPNKNKSSKFLTIWKISKWFKNIIHMIKIIKILAQKKNTNKSQNHRINHMLSLMRTNICIKTGLTRWFKNRVNIILMMLSQRVIPIIQLSSVIRKRVQSWT